MSEQSVDQAELMDADHELTEGTPDLAVDEQPERSSIIRTRIVPGIAGLLVLTIIGVIAWAMFAPESARQDPRTLVGRVLVFDNPKPAASFSLEPLGGGDQIDLTSFRGKTVLVNFWASWCGPCINEIPVLVETSRQLPDNVVLIGIDTLDEPAAAMDLSRELGINYLTLDDSGNAGGAVSVDYGVVGVPETYLIDPDGNLRAVLRGEFQSPQEVLDMVANSSS